MAERPYRPSCGSEGADFINRWCSRCWHEKKFRETQDSADACQIVARTFYREIDHPDYPREWVAEDGWKNPRCTAFQAEELGPPRCDKTAELPL